MIMTLHCNTTSESPILYAVMYCTCTNLDCWELDNHWYIVDTLWPPHIQLWTLVTMATHTLFCCLVCALVSACSVHGSRAHRPRKAQLMRDTWNSRHVRNPKIRLQVFPWQRGGNIGYHAPPSHVRKVEIGQHLRLDPGLFQTITGMEGRR